MAKAEKVLELLQMRDFANLARPDVPIPGLYPDLVSVPGRSSTGQGTAEEEDKAFPFGVYPGGRAVDSTVLG